MQTKTEKVLNIKVKFFSELCFNLKENIEPNETIIVKLSYPFTIAHLIEILEIQFPSLSSVIRDSNSNYVNYLGIVVNGRDFCHISNFKRILKDNDQVTFMYLGVGG